MENKSQSRTIKENIFLWSCLLVASLVLLLPYMHKHEGEELGISSDMKGQYQIVRYHIGDRLYTLEIADTEEKRKRGLGGREGLCETCGMLFIFDSPGRYGFWMKGMRFNIDILWLNDGRVVYKEENVASTKTETMTPSVAAESVIELPAKSGIEIGDVIKEVR